MTLHVLNEIDERITYMRSHARAVGTDLLPPLLALGTSERVGSNWMSDTLRAVMTQHNEPFRQQLGGQHPLSALNPQAVEIEDLSWPQLGPLGWHWLVTFAASKYSPSRQLIKETNLYFAAESLLRLFPDSPVVVLSRSPLGVASSFQRADLFKRWDYATRYRQMVAMTSSGPRRRFAALVPDSAPDDLSALTRMIVLNAIILAEALDGRYNRHRRYESAVLDSSNDPLIRHPPVQDNGAAGVDDRFVTNNAKTELVAYLTPAEATLVQTVTADTLSAARRAVSVQVLDRAVNWLSGAGCYSLAQLSKTKHTKRSEPRATAFPEMSYVYCRGLAWRNLLVSNQEFCDLLNQLHQAGVPNTVCGTHLMCTPMPHERGGRLHLDNINDCWTVSAGYEHHPVYWVTWIGAVVFAAVNSARLPSHTELCVLAAGTEPTNHSYVLGDTASVVQPDAPFGIHHLVGNVQVWCGDGPAAKFGEPLQRWIHGAAWNTPATPVELNRLRSRHLLGGSRGIGIRLVRDPSAPFTGPVVRSIATALDCWVQCLADRDRSLSEIDSELVELLSQTDVRLRAHV